MDFTLHSRAAKATFVALPLILVAAIVAYLVTRPDLTIVVEASESTAPNDVTDWIGKASRAIQRDMEVEKKELDDTRDNLSKSREWIADVDAGLVHVEPGQRDEVTTRIQRLEEKERDLNTRVEQWGVVFPYRDGSPFSNPDTTYWQSRSMAAVTLTLTNESDDPINDLRIRLTGASRVWRINTKAEFLPATERWAWERSFEPLDSFVADSFVLPTIRQLPAGQTLYVSVWGDVVSSKPEIVSAAAVRAETVHITRVYDRGLTAILLHFDEWKTWWSVIFVPVIGGPLWLFAKWLWEREIKSAREQAKKEAWRENIYMMAKAFTKQDGYQESAIMLLVWATREGYTKQEIRDDESFKPLWPLPLFRGFFGEPSAYLPGDADQEQD